MPRPSSTALTIAHVVLRILIVLNWIYGAIVLAILIGMVTAEQWTMTALGIPASAETRPLVMGMRAIAALGVVSVPINLAVLQAPGGHGRHRSHWEPVRRRQCLPTAGDRLGLACATSLEPRRRAHRQGGFHALASRFTSTPDSRLGAGSP